jgi:hypothetical protein
VCAALVAYPAVTADEYPEAALVPGVGAAVLLLVSLAGGWPSFVAWTLALLAGEYAIGLSLRADDAVLDAAAPLYAAGLLVSAELAYWSLELRQTRREDVSGVAARVAAIGVLAVLSVFLGAFVVFVTTADLGGGLAWDAAGVVAAAGALAIVAILARRRPG